MKHLSPVTITNMVILLIVGTWLTVGRLQISTHKQTFRVFPSKLQNVVVGIWDQYLKLYHPLKYSLELLCRYPIIGVENYVEFRILSQKSNVFTNILLYFVKFSNCTFYSVRAWCISFITPHTDFKSFYAPVPNMVFDILSMYIYVIHHPCSVYLG